MRFFRTIIFAALTATLFNVAPSSAEGISGAEFKKLVMGNTFDLRYFSNSTGKYRQFRFYFTNEKMLFFTSAGSSQYQADEPWSVTDDGKWCRVSSRSGRSICYDACQLKEKKLICKNRRGSERKFTILKGKHEW